MATETNTTPVSTTPTHRDRLVDAGIAVGAAVAFAASLSTLADLARAAAWRGHLAYAFPVSIDVLAIAAVRVWLSRRYSDAARRYARRVAMATVVGSIVGNAVQHLIAAGYLTIVGGLGIGLVVTVGAVPPAVVAAAVHLRSLITEPVPSHRAQRRRSRPVSSRPASETVSPSVVSPETRPAETGDPSRTVSRSQVVGRSRQSRSSGGAARSQDAKVSQPVELDELELQRLRHLDAKYRENGGAGELVAHVVELDDGYRAQHGRRINRATLREALREYEIGRNEDAGLLLRALDHARTNQAGQSTESARVEGVA